MRKIVITSGYFNPLHIGHINLIREAKNLGDYLVVIVNNDDQVRIKESVAFMPQEERMKIVGAIKYVDEVFLSIDKDKSQSESLKAVAMLHPGELFFAKGGDRNSSNIPEGEIEACKQFNIKIVNGVGGEKVQSSSWLLKKVSENQDNKQ